MQDEGWSGNEDVQVVPSALFVCVLGQDKRIPYYRPAKHSLSLERNQRLRGNCFNLPPCSTRETTLKAKQHQSPESTTTLSEYELSLYELPTPANKRVVPDVTLLKADLESSFASVKESFNISTVLANQTGCKRKVANVDFPTDLDYSFHTGQLNATLNSVPPLQLSETGCSDSQLESCGNTSHYAVHYAVPDNDNSLASLTSEVPLRDELTDNTDFYDHDLPVTKKAKSTAAAYQEPPANPPLPVLFYPRKKGIVRKRKTNVHRRK